jgi:hypothetical protein
MKKSIYETCKKKLIKDIFPYMKSVTSKNIKSTQKNYKINRRGHINT